MSNEMEYKIFQARIDNIEMKWKIRYLLLS